MLVSCALMSLVFHRGMSGLTAVPVIRLSCALMVRVFWQAGTAHTFTSPLQAAVASSVPLGENWQAQMGRSSPNSLLCMPMQPIRRVRPHPLWGKIFSGETCLIKLGLQDAELYLYRNKRVR